MAAAVLLVLATPALAAKVTVAGDVTYTEKVPLPADAALELALVDLMQPDIPRVTASAAISDRGKIPLTFSLTFDDKVLLSSHHYGLTARIVSGSDVWFTTDAPIPVDPAVTSAPLEVTVAFAGVIQSPSPAAPPEDGSPTGIVGVTWQADTLGDAPVPAGSRPTLSIGEDMRAGGRGGCNSWFSEVALADQTLTFSAVAATRMACPTDQQSAEEQAFFDVLAATRFWRIDNGELILSGDNGSQLASFSKARY